MGKKRRPLVRDPGSLLHAALALVAFLVPLLLYLDTLAPTVLAYDSGMLQAKAYVLGIGHPTGYPTFILLGHLFTYLPVGDIAYRVNLSSAVYGALASLFVYLAARRLAGRSALGAAAAVLAALAFAASPTFWSQAVVAEVYTLNAFLVAATLHALLVWRDLGGEGRLLFAAFLTGLAMTAHMTSGLLLPAGLVFVFLVERGVLKHPATLVRAATAFFAGLLPYLYLPLRAAMEPPLDYVWSTATLGGFLNLLTGASYQDQMFAFGPLELPGRLAMYGELLVGQYQILLLAAAAVGAWALLRADRAALALLAVYGLGSVAYALEYDIHDIAIYFIPSYLVIALLMSTGLHSLATAARGLLDRAATNARSASARSAASLLVLVVALLAVVPTLPGVHRAVDQSDNFAARRLVEAIVEETETGATVFGARSLPALYYAQLIEGRREDLHTVTALEAETISEYLYARTRGMDRRIDAYLIQVEPNPSEDTEGVGYRLEPASANYAEDLEELGYRLERVSGDLYRVSRAP